MREGILLLKGDCRFSPAENSSSNQVFLEENVLKKAARKRITSSKHDRTSAHHVERLNFVDVEIASLPKKKEKDQEGEIHYVHQDNKKKRKEIVLGRSFAST